MQLCCILSYLFAHNHFAADFIVFFQCELRTLYVLFYVSMIAAATSSEQFFTPMLSFYFFHLDLRVHRANVADVLPDQEVECLFKLLESIYDKWIRKLLSCWSHYVSENIVLSK